MDKDINKKLSSGYTKDAFGGHQGLLAVREDPTRHISSTDKDGIFNMYTEIIDNAFDESKQTIVSLKKIKEENGDTTPLEPLHIGLYLNNTDGTCAVADQGRGAPIEPSNNHPTIPVAVAIFQEDNMGSKGTKAGATQDGYTSNTIGVHGAGAFVVTACSEDITIHNRVWNPETELVDIYEIRFHKGVPIENDDWHYKRMNLIGTDPNKIANNRSNTGMTVTYKPDLDIMQLYNPVTNQMDETFYDIDNIIERLSNTLATMGEEFPIIVSLRVDGEGATEQVFDSREMSLTKGLVAGEDFVRVKFESGEERFAGYQAIMDERRISEFNADIIVKKTDTPDALNRFVGYVNSIKVSSSPHLGETKLGFYSEARRIMRDDAKLDGFFSDEQMRGLEIIVLLGVEDAKWDGQVKTQFADRQVSDMYGQMVNKLPEMQPGGALRNMIEYSCEASKPYMLMEKDKHDNQEAYRKQQEQKLQQMQVQREQTSIAPESLRYLQNTKNRELVMNYPVEQSTLVILEGRSAENKIVQLTSKFPNLAVYSGITGKINNVNNIEVKPLTMSLQAMADNGLEITIVDKLNALFAAGFYSILIIADNDADGAHIKALLRLFTWRYHPNLINEGRYFELSPSFCTYEKTTDEELEYTYLGEEKTIKSKGSLDTQAEYTVVRHKFPGKLTFMLFKGVASIPSSLLAERLTNGNEWKRVPPLTTKEEHEIDALFTNSSNFKRAFTKEKYVTDTLQRKDYVRGTIYKDTRPRIEELLDARTRSDTPIFDSTSRRTLEDYEELGSAEIERKIMDETIGGYNIY